MRLLKYAPHTLFACAALGMAIWAGVTARDALAYLVFCAVFSLGPGLALYFAIWPSCALNARAIALGWALGFVLETLAFSLTAQLGARPLFLAYPVLIIAACGILVLRRRPKPSPDAPRKSNAIIPVLLALASLVLLVYFVFAFYLPSPLPGTVSGVTYFVDYPYSISLAAQALHQVPITDPHISGNPLSYYFNQFFDMAAATQVFGIPLPAVALRLYILPLIALLPVQYFALGKAASGKSAIGLLAVVFGLFLGEGDLDVREPALFGNWGIGYLHISGSYALGLVMTLAIFIVLVEMIQKKAGLRSHLLVLALLLIGLGGTKASALPVVTGGLTLFLAFQMLQALLKRASPTPMPVLPAFAAWALSVIILLVFFLVIYKDMDRSASIAPLQSLWRMEAVTQWRQKFPALPALVFAIPAIIGFAPAHVAGIAALLARPRAITQQNALLLGVILAGFAAFLMLDYPNYGQILFLYYAMPAACVLAAIGVMELWQAARRGAHTRWARAALAPVLALILLAGMDAPFDARLNFSKWRSGQPVYTQSTQLTPGMYAAYTWLRQNTNPADVIAVNTALIDKTIYIIPTPHNFYAAAFAERSVFLEGWAYSNEAHRLGYKDVEQLRVQPFPERKALNDRVFVQADPQALAVMRDQFGVRYLFVDKRNAPPSPNLSAISQNVFENGDAVIYKIQR